jgi:hypothetical protein
MEKWKTKTRFPTFPRAARDYNDYPYLPNTTNQNQERRLHPAQTINPTR